MRVKTSTDNILKYFLFSPKTEFDMSDFQGKISKTLMFPESSSSDFAQSQRKLKKKQDKIIVGNSEQPR